MRLSSLSSVVALAWAISAIPAQAVAADASPTLLTTQQQQIDEAALALARDPQILAARDAVVKAWSALPPAQLPDGKAKLAAAADELVYFSVRNAIEKQQFAPSIVWTEAPPYKHGTSVVPGSRFGIDNPDRIYRTATVDPGLRYVIRGQRSARPSNNDFLFEVTDAGLKTIANLGARDIDVSADGSFTITADSTPAAGRRNHLTLPPTSSGLLIRDTLADWGDQLPNRLSIEVAGGAVPKRGSIEDARRDALALIRTYSQFNAQILSSIWQIPANQLVPKVRSLEWGVEGAIVGTSRFSLGDDEALVLTIDGQGADYIGLQLTDPWARSLNYWNKPASLSNRQVQPNPDGTITYIISPRDPGFRNWVSTDGLNDGLFALRVENFSSVDPAKLIRSANVVKLSQLQAVLPADATRISPAQRAQELAQREAAYANRLTY